MKQLVRLIVALVLFGMLSSCGLGGLPMAAGRTAINTGSNLVSSASGLLN